jgi:hypothetical protein
MSNKRTNDKRKVNFMTANRKDRSFMRRPMGRRKARATFQLANIEK